MKIEKGIKVPSVRNDYVSVIKEMKVGDSVLFDSDVQVHGFIHRGREMGMQMTRRTVEGGIRVWKVGKIEVGKVNIDGRPS